MKKVYHSALAAVAVLLVPFTGYCQNTCITKAEHSAFTVLLVDETDPAGLGESYKQSIEALKTLLVPKERLVAISITDKRANASVLLDVVKPEPTVWESKLVIRKKEKAFEDCIASLLSLSMQIEPTPTPVPVIKPTKGKGAVKPPVVKKELAATALLETLLFVDEILRTSTSQTKRMMIYSDMIQNSDVLSFYKISPKDTAEKLLKQVETERLIPNFQGVSVLVSGVGGSHTDKQARIAESFWRLFFEKAGAALKFYGPVLVG